ncbi:YgjV family protein [Acidovorax sp. sic0104]|uniref:YgjV family protein n=1 Tax=Acidovorax sp. sic0104 TaxID=2854784 RepID=UPI001C45AE20|nr:YgjV family protein [Acidovorax sp. sic0104]MBV7541984.1 YgjV family protein [Acidovorax sp. sic0104]
MLFFAAHATGIIALILNVVGLIVKNDTALRRNAFWASLFTIAHNAAIGSATATALCSIIFLRNYMAIRPNSLTARKKVLLCVAFVAATWAAAAVTWSGPISALLALGSSCVTYAFFYLGGVRLRLVIGMNCLAWLSNAIIYESPWQFATGCLAAGAAFIGAWRIHSSSRQSLPA